MRLTRLAVPVALLAALLVAGCQAPDASDRSAPTATTTGTSADPLSDIESTVDAVEQDVDSDG